jgi:hypothetical protein
LTIPVENRRLPLALFCAIFLVLLAPGAIAQGNLPDVAPLGATPPGQQQAPQPSDMPETHAAPGGAESTLPEGNEPQLPDDPLEISDEVRGQIGTDANLEILTTPEATKREFYGLYYNETAKAYRYRVAFPLWAERIKPSLTDPKIPDRASVFGGLYYQRRSADHRDDVLFPLMWNLQNPLEKSRSTLVGPFFNRRTKQESDDWLLPLYATGRREKGGYTLIPPLLTSLHADENGGFNLVGLGYCKWEGGQRCDTRTAQKINLGLAPFYFFGQSIKGQHEIVTPLLHYYRYNSRSQEWTNIYGPYFRRHKLKRENFHLIPLYWSIWGEEERHTTVAPLFHFGRKKAERLLITPLFLSKRGQEGQNTFVTWGYARHRGDTNLDMVTPLFWHHRDPRIGLDRKLLFPFLYTNQSPREDTTVFFPFWAYQDRHGISTSLWVTPLFNYKKHLRGSSVALNPLIYFGKNGHDAHRVVAPLYFDLEKLKSRMTIVPPGLFFRLRSEDTTFQVVANTLYKERRYSAGKAWEFHFLPLFSYGRSPGGHFWNVLFGFTGYQRKGSQATMRALWVPIPLSQ